MKSFESEQEKHWSNVRQGRYSWATKHPFVSLQEKQLLSVIDTIKGDSLLEVGCGEGPNLFNISNKFQRSGVDYSKNLIEFAKENVKDATFYCQDATDLKFPDNSFDIVMCRDLMHHLRDRSTVVKEMHRVCKPGGRVVFIESNGRNPIIYVASFILNGERDVRHITPKYMRHLLSEHHILSWTYAEPLSIWRVLFRHKYGLPKLATYRIVQFLYGGLDKVLHYLIPKKMWGYMIIQIQKSPSDRNQNDAKHNTTHT